MTLSVRVACSLVSLAACLAPPEVRAENWPGWRGPQGNAVSSESNLPVEWSADKNVRWKAEIAGKGFSSPVVWGDRVFVTSAFEHGLRRAVYCLDRRDGKSLWSAEVEHDDPEVASSMTGHAASTPATDGKRLVVFFGNAGVVCYDLDGRKLWQRNVGQFESELGLASSPRIIGECVYLVCDHDGDRFQTFDSFLLCLDLATGKTVWKTDRPGLFRSWSSPLAVPAADGKLELIVNAQDELRAYDPQTGRQLWSLPGMTGWVTPSPVFGQGLIFAVSGKDGPVLSVRPGGQGDVSETHLAWRKPGGPYVCSPVLYDGHLYVHNELGILTCFDAATGDVKYRQRLGGRFFASSVAGDGKIYLTDDAGITHVVAAGANFKLLASNELGDYSLASPAISQGNLFLRSERFLFCIGSDDRNGQ